MPTLIDLVSEYGEAMAELGSYADFETDIGGKKTLEQCRKYAKVLLQAILEREPTKEEIDQCV